MRTIAPALLMAFCLLPGCRKVDFVIPDEPFTDLRMEKVTTNYAWYDVVPANNDFHYLATYLPKAVADLYGDALVDSLDRAVRDVYAILIEGESSPASFEETCLDKGAFYEPVKDLYPGMDYIAVGFPYDQSGNAVHKLTKYEFSTLAQPVSDITFTFEMTGSLAKITPSNNDSFFCYYDSKDYIDKKYVYPSYYYSTLLDYFWEYGFLETEYLMHGPQEDDFSEFFELKAGDKFYVMASGYDNGMSSELTTFVVTYKGPGEKADVEPYTRAPLMLSSVLRKCSSRQCRSFRHRLP